MIFENREQREAFLEYLRNLSPLVLLLTAGIFFYDLADLDESRLRYLFVTVGSLAGVVAFFSAIASAIQFYSRYSGPDSRRPALVMIIVAVNSLVGAAYLMAALSADNL